MTRAEVMKRAHKIKKQNSSYIWSLCLKMAWAEAKAQKEEKMESNDGYFKSEAARLIFFLVELDGEARMDKLNVTMRLYRDADKARAWRDSIIKVIHPDVCRHPQAGRATEIVNEIYSRMVRR